MMRSDLLPLSVLGHSPFRGCEQITFNAETAEAAEKKCLRISLRALRALRSNVAFFHRLFRGLPPRPMRILFDTGRALMTRPWFSECRENWVTVAQGLCGTLVCWPFDLAGAETGRLRARAADSGPVVR